MQRINQINRLTDFLVIIENAHEGDTREWLAEFTDAQLRHYEDNIVRQHGDKLGMHWDASTRSDSDGGIRLESARAVDSRVTGVHAKGSTPGSLEN